MYFLEKLYLYLNKYLEHTKSDIKKLFVVKATCIFWLIDVNINWIIFLNTKNYKFLMQQM